MRHEDIYFLEYSKIFINDRSASFPACLHAGKPSVSRSDDTVFTYLNTAFPQSRQLFT